MPSQRKSPRRTLKRRSSGKAFANGRVTRRSSKRNTYKGVDGPNYRGIDIDTLKGYVKTQQPTVHLGSDVLLSILEEVSQTYKQEIKDKAAKEIDEPVKKIDDMTRRELTEFLARFDSNARFVQGFTTPQKKRMAQKRILGFLKGDLQTIFTNFKAALVLHSEETLDIQEHYQIQFQLILQQILSLMKEAQPHSTAIQITYTNDDGSNEMFNKNFLFQKFLANPTAFVQTNILSMGTKITNISFP